jgi:hypothetical protein
MSDGNVDFYVDPVFPFAWGRLSTLLEDDEIGRWASEAAVKYRVSALDALDALAQALALDQHRFPVTEDATGGLSADDHL